MFPCTVFGYGFWWIFPLVMIVMIALCFFMMRGRMGSMMCRPGFHSTSVHGKDASGPTLGVLDKRYAQGENNKEEYKRKKMP
jgi:uncharacterized membrane protein